MIGSGGARKRFTSSGRLWKRIVSVPPNICDSRGDEYELTRMKMETNRPEVVVNANESSINFVLQPMDLNVVPNCLYDPGTTLLVQSQHLSCLSLSNGPQRIERDMTMRTEFILDFPSLWEMIHIHENPNFCLRIAQFANAKPIQYGQWYTNFWPLITSQPKVVK